MEGWRFFQKKLHSSVNLGKRHFIKGNNHPEVAKRQAKAVFT
jgi:hypothetical protein